MHLQVMDRAHGRQQHQQLSGTGQSSNWIFLGPCLCPEKKTTKNVPTYEKLDF